MSRDWGIRLLFWLIGAAVGAAAVDVRWTFWAFWSLALASWFLIAHFHRGHNGNGAHA